jgi:hypothetical protein
VLAVAEVHVEGAAREACAGADRVEARGVEAARAELGRRGVDQRLARLGLGALAERSPLGIVLDAGTPRLLLVAAP